MKVRDLKPKDRLRYGTAYIEIQGVDILNKEVRVKNVITGQFMTLPEQAITHMRKSD